MINSTSVQVTSLHFMENKVSYAMNGNPLCCLQWYQDSNYSFLCCFSKFEHVAHYKAKNKESKHSKNKCAWVHTHACMHVCLHTHHTHAHTYACTHTPHTCIHIHTRTCMHTHTHTHTHTHKHTSIHTHTHNRIAWRGEISEMIWKMWVSFDDGALQGRLFPTAGALLTGYPWPHPVTTRRVTYGPWGVFCMNWPVSREPLKLLWVLSVFSSLKMWLFIYLVGLVSVSDRTVKCLSVLGQCIWVCVCWI